MLEMCDVLFASCCLERERERESRWGSSRQFTILAPSELSIHSPKRECDADSLRTLLSPPTSPESIQPLTGSCQRRQRKLCTRAHEKRRREQTTRQQKKIERRSVRLIQPRLAYVVQLSSPSSRHRVLWSIEPTGYYSGPGLFFSFFFFLGFPTLIARRRSCGVAAHGESMTIGLSIVCVCVCIVAFVLCLHGSRRCYCYVFLSCDASLFTSNSIENRSS